MYKSVIRVDKRMSYNEIQGIIENDEEIIESTGFDKEKLNMIKLYEKLTNILLKRRQKNGYIGFDMPEVHIILDENGKTVGVENKKKIFAYSIIEHLMLTANEVVAETFTKKQVPVMYRVHEYPSLEKIEEVNLTLQKFGLKLNTFRIDEHLLNKKMYQTKDFGKDKDDNFVNYYVPQSEYVRVIEALKEKEEQNLITKEDVDFNYLQYILLRSMRQARYSMKNLGHFGLRK